MEIERIFWEASLEEMKNGYIYNEKEKKFYCLCCFETYEKGVIYPQGEMFLEAEKKMIEHIKKEHHSMFHFLLNMDKKYTSLTDNQKSLMEMFHEGQSDKEISKKLDSSASTIRNHRFALREKAKQAKIFLALMELLEHQMSSDSEDKLIDIHRNATTVDERYAITESEKEQYLKKYFENDKLLSFPNKQKRIIVILQHIASHFNKSQSYTEKDVNDILKAIYYDYVTIRRYLIEYGFLDRTADGSSYWVKL